MCYIDRCTYSDIENIYHMVRLSEAQHRSAVIPFSLFFIYLFIFYFELIDEIYQTIYACSYTYIL